MQLLPSIHSCGMHMTGQMETKNYGLYVHIPFCISKCTYCAFASVEKNDNLINDYTNALCREMTMHRAYFADKTFDTVFIGGGTPSCIARQNLMMIIQTIYDSFRIKSDEFTIEINPGTGSKEMFAMLKNLGVNRASIGLQCANDNVLKAIGRIHNVSQFTDTVREIKNAGLNNFSVDIMSGLPNEKTQDLIASIDLANSLGANHISMYTLKLEENTLLEAAVHKGAATLPTTDEEYQMSLAARYRLEELGYHRYEISNYARDGFMSHHNLKYWNRTPYLGVGVAAASMYENTRRCNTNSISDYISHIEKDKFPLIENTKLSKEEIAFEMIMLSTRLTGGMEYADYNQFTGEDFRDKYVQVIRELEQNRLIKKSNTHFALTPQGMDLQNSILLKFMD
jgi:oxygen-independent coproporphyrinogen-3 oxidase